MCNRLISGLFFCILSGHGWFLAGVWWQRGLFLLIFPDLYFVSSDVEINFSLGQKQTVLLMCWWRGQLELSATFSFFFFLSASCAKRCLVEGSGHFPISSFSLLRCWIPEFPDLFTLSDQHAMIVYLRCPQCLHHAVRILSDNENLSLTEEKLNLTRSIQPLRLKYLGQTKRILNVWLDKHLKSLPALLDADLSTGSMCEED